MLSTKHPRFLEAAWKTAGGLVLVVGCVLILLGVSISDRASDHRAEARRADEAALDGAMAVFEATFKQQWEARTRIGDEVLVWSGRDAKVLWVQHRVEPGTRWNGSFESFRLWAQTPSGRVFTVQCYVLLDCHGGNVSDRPQETSLEDLKDSLFRAGKLDILKQLGVTVHPA